MARGCQESTDTILYGATGPRGQACEGGIPTVARVLLGPMIKGPHRRDFNIVLKKNVDLTGRGWDATDTDQILRFTGNIRRAINCAQKLVQEAGGGQIQVCNNVGEVASTYIVHPDSSRDLERA